MEPAEILSLKVLSDPFIYKDCVYFTTNWVDGNEYVSIISKFDGGWRVSQNILLT